MKTYDLVIIGGSAAAITAGIYAARRGLNFKIITKDFGGEVATSGEIANWPGIIHTDGLTLAEQFKSHLESYKVDFEEGVEVETILKQDDGNFCITVKNQDNIMAADKVEDGHEVLSKCDYETKAVIVATGVHPRELNVPGEKEYRNKGVSYCTVCDGPLFGGKTTAVVGGGNSALEAGLMLADISAKVYMINKNNAFKGEQILLENLKSKKNVEIIYEAKTMEISGTDFTDTLKYVKAGSSNEIKVDGIFVHIGMIPNSWLVPKETAKTPTGEIMVNKNCETNIPGLYAAGDVTDISFNQIVIAAGQGCIATLSAVQYLNKLS